MGWCDVMNNAQASALPRMNPFPGITSMQAFLIFRIGLLNQKCERMRTYVCEP